MKSWGNDFSIHTNFPITTKISLFYWCKKVFMDDCEKIDEASLPEKKKIFTVLKSLEQGSITDAD